MTRPGYAASDFFISSVHSILAFGQTHHTLSLSKTPSRENRNSRHQHTKQKEGRQSPDPEKQSDAQIGVTADPNNQEGAKGDYSKDKTSGEGFLKGLESNPKGAVEENSQASTSKTQ
ncbi:hypothetical protein LTR49_028687 [Elasticomyces elasticus]|nr:hypothetical protein LTR49_028687 [Elasticomyces elasticus]